MMNKILRRTEMKQRGIEFIYSLNGTKITDCAAGENFDWTCSVKDDRMTASVTAKKKLTMQRFDIIFQYTYQPDDRFFANGYQSWTSSREYMRADQMPKITRLAKGEKLFNFAGISSDCRFVNEPTQAGQFHSHCYTYIKNNGKLFFLGSLTERQGFTVFYADMNAGTLTVSKDVEGVTLEAGESYDLFDMLVLEGAYDEVFDRYFAEMGVKKPRIDHMSGYTSWYNYFQKIDEKIITRDLNSLDIVKDSVSVFQVDDGYETFVGDWTDKNDKKFPCGMDGIANRIHEKGYLAGIWLAPFNVQIASRTYKEHPDWVIKYPNGKPVLGVAGWGGAYTLDIYKPEVQEHIRSFFNVILNDWGYDMVKLDFLYSQCMYPRNNKARGTIMCEAMEFLRSCCGDKLILGCGVPLGAAFGWVDACRISCDVDLKYDGKFYNKMGINNEIPSAQNAILNSVFRRHLDSRVFVNDPDVFFFRYSNLKFTIAQKVLLASVNHICGNVLFVSDNAAEYKGVDVDALKKVFAKSEFRILDANFVSGSDIVLDLEKNGKPMKLRLNLKTGASNAGDIMDIPVDR